MTVSSNMQNSKVPNNEETESLDIRKSQNANTNGTGTDHYNTIESQPIILPPGYKAMDDGDFSTDALNADISTKEKFEIENATGDYFASILHSNGLFRRDEIDLFNNRYRFGIMDPYRQLSSAREYLFFTKPDLNIYPRGAGGQPSGQLAKYLQTQPEWLELEANHKEVLKCLQASLDNSNPFNHLLGNTVSSNLEVPGLSSDVIETANSMYGVNVQYHGSSEASNDNFDFSLEFKDTKLLDVYSYFKGYELYHELAHHGVLEPWIKYVWFHILYDQFSIYKFMVDEDGETVVYYGKAYGVYSKSLPRDIFTNTDFSDGISYSVDFHAFQYRDMNPQILGEFNNLGRRYYESRKYRIDIYNEVFDRVDNRPAQAAAIEMEYHPVYGRDMPKLRWRGDAKY